MGSSNSGTPGGSEPECELPRCPGRKAIRASHQSSSKARSNGSRHAAASGSPRARCARIRVARGGRSSGGPWRRWPERRHYYYRFKVLVSKSHLSNYDSCTRSGGADSRQFSNLKFWRCLGFSGSNTEQSNAIMVCLCEFLPAYVRFIGHMSAVRS